MADGPPSVVILAGPNGAGKTTAAPFVLHEALGIDEFVNADDIARGLSGFAPERAAVAAGQDHAGPDAPTGGRASDLCVRDDAGDAVVRRRYERGLRSLWNLYLPVADDWSVYDNAGSRPDLIAVGSGRSVERIVLEQQRMMLRGACGDDEA
ncbi:MAG: hypothetical protein KJZ54_05460 [Phycisphaerales bacterium]|nr:hypothetical protein [Phycisphaerales bacterium]